MGTGSTGSTRSTSGSGSGGWGAAPGRTDRLVVAPVAQPRLVGTPLAGLGRTPDRLPQRLDLALGGEQVGLVRPVAQHLGVAEVDELQQVRDHAPGAPHDERVELHLEQRLGLEVLARRRAGLVVDDAHLAGGCQVDPVDVAVDGQPRVQGRDHVDLALGGLEALRVLQREVALEQVTALRRARSRGRSRGLRLG